MSFATTKWLAHAAERTLEMLRINHDAVTARLNVPVVISDAGKRGGTGGRKPPVSHRAVRNAPRQTPPQAVL